MTDSLNPRDLFPETLVVVCWVLAEVSVGTLWKSSVPLSPGEYVGMLLLVLVGSVGLLGVVRWGYRGLDRTLVHDITFAAGLAILGGKLWLVSGGKGVGLAAICLILPGLVLWAYLRIFRLRDQAVYTGGMFLVLAVWVSTDLLEGLWFRTRGLSVPGVLLALGLAGAVSLLVILLARGWATLRPRVRGRPKTAGLAVLVGVLLTGGLVHGTRVPRLLAAGDVPTDSHFEGDIERSIQTREAPHERPNLIVIGVDTLRWDMVPPRADNLELPNLKALRRDSLRFPRAYSTSSWTLPAFGSLFSGKLPIQHGAVAAHNKLYRSVPLYPQYLRSLDYATGGFTDGGYVSHRYGFARGYGVYWEQTWSTWSPFREFAPGSLEVYRALGTLLGWDLGLEIRHRPPSEYQKDGKRRFDRNIRAFRQWYRRLESPRRPFFAFLHTFQVHDYFEKKQSPPYYPENVRRLRREKPRLGQALMSPERVSFFDPRRSPGESFELQDFSGKGLPDFVSGRYQRRLEEMSPRHLKALRRYFGGVHPDHHGWMRHVIAAAPDDKWKGLQRLLGEEDPEALEWTMRNLQVQRARRQLYRYGVQDVDRAVGRLVSWLKDEGLYEGSIIVFLSDHGEGFALDHPVLKHDWQLHEVLTRVPLWIKFPDGGPTGRISSTIQILDVFPLLLRWMGVQVEQPRLRSEQLGWGNHRGVPVPRREIVRASVRSFGVDTPPRRLMGHPNRRGLPMGLKRSVLRNGLKAVRGVDTGATRYQRVFSGHLFEKPLRGAELPDGERGHLLEALRAYRDLGEQYPDPFSRKRPRLDPELRDQLEGLGYL